jgi:hypothetical protein
VIKIIFNLVQLTFTLKVLFLTQNIVPIFFSVGSSSHFTP